jgi:hypothetical protein
MASDLFILYAGVQFDQRSTQHRITINGSWLTIPLETGPRSRLIKDVKLVRSQQWASLAKSTIFLTCMGKRNLYRSRLDPLISKLETIKSDFLLDWNVELHSTLATILGITTPFVIDTEERPDLSKLERLDACLSKYSGVFGVDPSGKVYLSGWGSLQYMSFDSLKSVRETHFQVTLPDVDGNSVVQSIARDAEPTSIIRKSAVWKNAQGGAYYAA